MLTFQERKKTKDLGHRILSDDSKLAKAKEKEKPAIAIPLKTTEIEEESLEFTESPVKISKPKEVSPIIVQTKEVIPRRATATIA